MNYENATDEQINEAVTKSIGDKVTSAFGAILIRDLGINNYCNDWAYGGLIIQNAKINLLWNTESTEWEAQAVVTIDMYQPPTCEYYYYDKNPLRAAMIVYLMMNEGK